MAIENENNSVERELSSTQMENVSGGDRPNPLGIPNVLESIYCYGDPNGQKHEWKKYSGVEGGHMTTYRCTNCGKVRIDKSDRSHVVL